MRLLRHLEQGDGASRGLEAPIDMAKLHSLFGHLVGVGLDLPDRIQVAEKK
jgi:hypothetical protein